MRAGASSKCATCNPAVEIARASIKLRGRIGPAGEKKKGRRVRDTANAPVVRVHRGRAHRTGNTLENVSRYTPCVHATVVDRYLGHARGSAFASVRASFRTKRKKRGDPARICALMSVLIDTRH